MSLAGSLAASLLATLTRPSWWAMALAAFLVRGGVLVLILPIVALPTVAGLANTFGPMVVGLVFAGPSPGFIVAVGGLAVAVLAWLVIGGVVGGALDLALVREAARDEEVDDHVQPVGGGPWRALALRVLAHVPTVIVLGLGAVRLVEAGYEELIRPGDPAIPVVLRVAFRIPEIVALLLATWIFGETVGGLAVRHLAWGASIAGALGRGLRSLVRPAALATLILTNATLGAVILGTATAGTIAWDHLRVVLLDGGSATDVRLALVVFSLTWVAGVWLLSLSVAWRSAAWTFELARRQPHRTMGPGDP
jgi:hypothetical protein